MRSRAPLALFIFVLNIPCNVAGRSQKAVVQKDDRPAFDAVSIHQIEAYKRDSAPGSTSYTFAPHKPCVYSDDKVLCQLALGELIREAYQRKRYEVIGPGWLMEDLFVFQAILPEKTSKEEAHRMLQRALEERFGLQSHAEKRRVAVYEMVAGSGGPRLTLADPPDKQKKLVLAGHAGATVVNSAGKFSAVAMRLDDLCPWIERSAGLDRPVLNGTSLDQRYKIDLHWNPLDNTATRSGESDPGIINALKSQAGLILQKQDVPMDILVIDHLDRTPTANH